MRRTSIIAAAIGSLVASSAFAGFTVTASLGATAGGLERWDVSALNTGGDTGVQIKGLEYFYNGSPVTFQVDDADENGTPDTVNLLSTSATRIRVATSTNTYVGLVPEGLGVEPNPYSSPRGQFQGAIANTGTTNANTGAGFQIARIFIPVGGSGVLSGNLGGDIGTKVPFSVNIGVGGPGNTAPTIDNDLASTSVVFGQIVSNGAPFSIIINGSDVDSGQLLTLSLGALPAGLSNVTVSPATSGSPASFTVTGTVDYSLNGTTVVVPITLSDNGTPTGSDTGSFSIVVTPEPASLALVGLSSLFMGRRRK